MTKQEWELKKAEQDMIVENAEVTCYQMLIGKRQMAGGVFSNCNRTIITKYERRAKNGGLDKDKFAWNAGTIMASNTISHYLIFFTNIITITN